MLDSFRSSVNSIWTKILLAMLVVMFGVWGIGDMIRNPSSKITVATVGSVPITGDEFAHAMRREAENISRIMGDNFSPAILKDPSLVHYVLLQLVNNSLLKQESEALGIVPGDADVVRRIRTNPAFADKNGNFDKSLFEATLKNGNISEANYVNKLRQDMASNLLSDTITARAPVLDIAARTLLAAREEGRNISLYSLKPTLIVTMPAPNEAQLKAYYEVHTNEFTAPEYRIASYVTISSANVKDAKVPETELQAAYNEHKDEFKKPEQREVEQLLYSSEDKANKASELLKAGKSFEQVAKETDILNKGALSLGKVERGKIIENAADQVFLLQKGQATAPIQSPFGWHIFRVTAIEPPSVSTLDEVRPQLEKELGQHTADQALNNLANHFQDALAGGASLAEAAHDDNLKVISVGPVDRQGNTLEKTVAKDIPTLDKFLDVVFKTDEKSDSAMATSKGGIYYIVHVDKVIPERLRTLDEVKGSLATAWQNEERGKRLGDLAKDIGAKFVHPSERAAVIAKYDLEPFKTATVKRNARSADDVLLPPKLLADAFSRKPQEGSNAYATPNGDYLLAVVNSVVPAPSPDKDPKMAAALSAITKGLETQGQNEILQQYVEFIAKKYPVSYNESALQAVLK